MRRSRKNSINKERIIMIASSAFVLAALTMTGIYMKGGNVESRDDGYTLDFTALEDSADNKFQEIAQNNQQNMQNKAKSQPQIENYGSDTVLEQQATEDDLDYMPLEVGSSQVEIPGLTDQESMLPKEDNQDPEITGEEKHPEETAGNSVIVDKELHFSEETGLIRPVQSDILMHYSMDKSIYFATLDQYKYNPATIFTADQGSSVIACAQGKVMDIFENEEIGKAVTLDLGDGYQVTYGQLQELSVKENAYVDAGDSLGSVAAPTKYYSAEGSNLYFQLTHNGEPVNAEAMFR